MTTFDDFRQFPADIRGHLQTIEMFVGDVDGKDIAIRGEDENSFIDGGTIDAEDAVVAVNALAAEVKRLQGIIENMREIRTMRAVTDGD